MADAPGRTSTRTTLKWGTIEAPVGLFKTTADPEKLIAFERGGPKGGRLENKIKTGSELAPVQSPASDPLATSSAPRQEARPEAAAKTVGGDLVLVESNTGRIVKPEEVRKGVWRTLREDAEGKVLEEEFVDCTLPLQWIEEATELDRMEIQGAIDVGRVPRERVTGSYYLGVDGEDALKVLGLLFAAMKETRRALVVKWTKTCRQATGVLVPSSRGGADTILLLQLCWPEDWRDCPQRANLFGADETISDGERQTAIELVRAMADSSLLLEDQRDDALSLRQELYDMAIEGDVGDFVMPVPAPEAPPLLAELERSLETAQA